MMMKILLLREREEWRGMIDWPWNNSSPPPYIVSSWTIHDGRTSPPEKHGVPIPILLDTPFIIFLLGWVEFLPTTRGIDMFIPFIPPPIHHFCQIRILAKTFQVGVRSGRGELDGFGLFNLSGGLQVALFGVGWSGRVGWDGIG